MWGDGRNIAQITQLRRLPLFDFDTGNDILGYRFQRFGTFLGRDAEYVINNGEGDPAGRPYTVVISKSSLVSIRVNPISK